jgi:hypothetical protein
VFSDKTNSMCLGLLAAMRGKFVFVISSTNS